MEFAWPFEHSQTISLLQSAYSEYQIGAFENFHQLVEDTLIVLRPRLKVIFQYELRFANRLKSQLLISHRFLLIKRMPGGGEEGEIKTLLGNIPSYFGFSINFCFSTEVMILGALSANGRCSAFASSHGARIQTSRSSSVVRITGMALGMDRPAVPVVNSIVLVVD
jgi:hypothetical protein